METKKYKELNKIIFLLLALIFIALTQSCSKNNQKEIIPIDTIKYSTEILVHSKYNQTISVGIDDINLLNHKDKLLNDINYLLNQNISLSSNNIDSITIRQNFKNNYPREINLLDIKNFIYNLNNTGINTFNIKGDIYTFGQDFNNNTVYINYKLLNGTIFKIN